MKKQTPLDWTHLPEGTETISLWRSLHDGELRAIRSSLLDRTVRLEFSVDYVVTFHNLAEGLTFILLLEGVKSVRVVKWIPWPGDSSAPEGAPAKEQQRLVEEYHAKWRQESESWNAFEGRECKR